jgi:hypothetical protein
MSMNITYRVRWLLNEAQVDQAMAIRAKHEQSEAFRHMDEDYGMESLMIEPREPVANVATLWWGSVRYPAGLDFLAFEEFQEIVLGFVSELRRTLGGESWEVFLDDYQNPAKWDEAKGMFY